MTLPAETKEQQKETPQSAEFKAQGAFDGSKEWKFQVFDLLTKAMGDKYKPYMEDRVLTYMTSDYDYGTFVEKREDIKSMKLEHGSILFMDEDGKVIATFEMGRSLEQIITEHYEHDCTVCKRRSTRQRARLMHGFGYEFDSLMRGEGNKRRSAEAGAKTKLPSKPPLSPEEREANEEAAQVFANRKSTRDEILQTAQRMEDEEFDITANISPTIQDDDQEEFHAHWKFMDYHHEINELWSERPNAAAGYRFNPFNRNEKERWNEETLRQLIQGSIFNSNERLFFKEVSEKIYNDRYDDFKKELTENGVPKVILDLLDEEAGDNDSEDLQKTYKKLKKISSDLAEIKDPKDVPEKYKDIYPHRDKLDLVNQALGDYIAYAALLVNRVDKLRYDEANETAERELLMQEYDKNPAGERIDTPRNRVVESLRRIFKDGVESPEEYSSELNSFFEWLGLAEERPINFQDLNGNTMTAYHEWFTESQSPDTAYKLAFEQIGKQRRKDDGTWEQIYDANEAVTHIDRLLELGIMAYDAMPSERSMKDIIDDLNEEGVDIRFSGNLPENAKSLYRVLAINNLGELEKGDGDKAELIHNERLRFIRIGSVIWQRNIEQRQKRLEAERQVKELCGITVKLKPAEAEEIIAKLRESGKFDENRLTKIKNNLVGGIGIAIDVTRPQVLGAGAGINYDLGEGFRININGAIFRGGGQLGAGVGKTFEVTEDLEISIMAGGGRVFSDAGGWGLGAGGSIKKKFSTMDVSVQVGAGVLLNQGGPIVGVGGGIALDWAKRQESFQEALTRKQVETHLDELNASSDPYAKIKENPDRYPEFRNLQYRLDSFGCLSEEAKQDLFMAIYETFKDGVVKSALDETTKNWYERFLPTGLGLGFVMVGGIVPVPYAYLEFEVASRNLVYRIAADTKMVGDVTEAEATRAIMESYKKQAEVKPKTLTTTTDLTWDPEKNRFALIKPAAGAGIDFSELEKANNKFQEFRDELSANANIFVEVADLPGGNMGLMSLRPQEAHGNIEVYVDSSLGNDVIVTSKGGRLYVSVQKGRPIFIRREDITYPFEQGGAVEISTIVITDNPASKTEIIKAQSPFFMEQLMGREWKRKPRSEAEGKIVQQNFKTFSEYTAWWMRADRKDRLEFTNAAVGMRESYDKLFNAVSVSMEREASGAGLRTEVKTKIEELVKDKDFIKEYRRLSTEGYDLIRDKKRPIIATWRLNFPELTQFIQEKIGVGELRPAEIDAALTASMVASFLDLQSKEPAKAKEEFARTLDTFHRPLLKSIFTKYYEETITDPGQREKKAQETADWIIDQAKGIDVASEGKAVEKGTLFATLVGMGNITGIRWMYNFDDTDYKYGMLGERPLDVKTADISGEVARFWVKHLSPYTPGLQKAEIPPAATPDKYKEYQDKMRDALYAPLTLKLIPFVSLTFTPEEMDKLTMLYQGEVAGAIPARVLVNNDNIGVVRKLLDICDRVREAELLGEKEVALDAGKEFVLQLDARVSIGIYKRCGNPSGLLRENFAIVHTRTKKVYFAGMAEGLIGVQPGYTKADISIMAGLAVPIPCIKRVGPEEPPPQKPEEPQKPELPEITPPEVLPPPTTAEQQPATPTPAAGGGGEQTGGTPTGAAIPDNPPSAPAGGSSPGSAGGE